MKISIVSDAIYPYNKGGKEKRIYELSTRLAAHGDDVHIYCMKWWGGTSRHRIENGVHLHAISPLYPLYSGKRRSFKQAILFSLACLKLLKEDFDVIEVDHMPHLVLFSMKFVCLVKKKKLFAAWNEVWGRKYWIEYLGLLGNIAYIVEWLSARMPDRIIAISEHTKKELKNILKIKTAIAVVPLGINLKEIRKVLPAKERSDIIFAGRLLTHKNVDVLIKTIKILKDDYPRIKAFIIGEGPEKTKLQKLVTSMNLHKQITFFNFFDQHKNLYALMKASKVFVFPSTREGFGIVALEANACGIPVVTINHKNNASSNLIHEGENGLLSTLSSNDLAQKISQLLQADTKKLMCEKIAANYDWEVVYQRAKKIYENR